MDPNNSPSSPDTKSEAASRIDDVVEVTLTEAAPLSSANPGKSDDWVTLRVAADAAQISVSTLRRWYRAGRIESRLARGPRGNRREVKISEVLQEAGGVPELVADEAGAAAEVRREDSDSELQPIAVASAEDVVPIQRAALEKILEQIGNLHEIGQQLAAARERAARAEERYAFEVERRKLLENRLIQFEELREQMVTTGPLANDMESVAASFAGSDSDTAIELESASGALSDHAAENEDPSIPQPDRPPDSESESTDSRSVWSSVPIVVLDSDAGGQVEESQAQDSSSRWQRFLDRVEQDLDRILTSKASTWKKRYRSVLGLQMAYYDVGAGDPILFLHGNAASSYSWRNVMPHLEGHGRLIAPDLIGMGDSAKLFPSGPGSYSLADHRTYLDALLQELGVVNNVTLVVHDLGSVLGLDWAQRHRNAVKAIVHMEALIGHPTREDWPEDLAKVFMAIRSELGEELVLKDNALIEEFLPASVLRELTDEEMGEYRRPFAEAGEARRSALSWVSMGTLPTFRQS
jgi:haloalkane dehalogenase